NVLITAKTKEVRQLREELAEVLAKHLNISKAVARTDVIPYLRVIFNTNVEAAAKLALGLNLSESMVRYISQQNASKIVELMNKLRTESSRKVERPKQERVSERRRDTRGKPGTLDSYFTSKS
ncbi:MAG: hypothetical protein QXO85_06455, partial [Sulfolobales archaeon]